MQGGDVNRRVTLAQVRPFERLGRRCGRVAPFVRRASVRSMTAIAAWRLLPSSARSRCGAFERGNSSTIEPSSSRACQRSTFSFEMWVLILPA